MTKKKNVKVVEKLESSSEDLVFGRNSDPGLLYLEKRETFL